VHALLSHRGRGQAEECDGEECGNEQDDGLKSEEFSYCTRIWVGLKLGSRRLWSLAGASGWYALWRKCEAACSGWDAQTPAQHETLHAGLSPVLVDLDYSVGTSIFTTA
jgi:hypothetical protein